MRSARAYADAYVRSAVLVAGVALRHRQAERRHERLLRPALPVVGGEHPLDRVDPPGLVATIACRGSPAWTTR